mmetsp:Transcript_7434/g.27818  ORF Transcript_7434/g.27818 Transcript_7434/m.27818 type:complete len:112 (-) Transcript_7434:871-1206(-)
MYLTLLEVSITEYLLHWFESLLEQIIVELLEFGTSQSVVVVNTLEERFNLNASLVLRGESSLCTLNSTLQLLLCSVVDTHVLLVLALEVSHEEFHHSVIEILSSQVGISSS